MTRSTEWLDALEDLIGHGDKVLNAYDPDGDAVLEEEEMRRAHKEFKKALLVFEKVDKKEQQGK